MTAITLRPATPNDDAHIAALPESAHELFFIQPGGVYPWTDEQVARLRYQRTDLTVMLSGDELVGFANLYDFTPKSHAFIGNLVIKPGRRGQGLGRRLIAHMLSLVFVHYRLPEARISVFEDNREALSLYQRLGFEGYAQEERKDGEGRPWRLLHLRKKALL